jgi:predicted AlkP superfamily phosphohydrolase/phosphomutase
MVQKRLKNTDIDSITNDSSINAINANNNLSERFKKRLHEKINNSTKFGKEYIDTNRLEYMMKCAVAGSILLDDISGWYTPIQMPKNYLYGFFSSDMQEIYMSLY